MVEYDRILKLQKERIIMATVEKIKEMFDYYAVKSEVDTEYEDWVVSKDADVINVEYAYPIYTHQVKAKSADAWLEHMRDKTWFDGEEESNFQKAYKRAEEILGK